MSGARFIKYELSTGRIVMTGFCPSSALSYQAETGYGIIVDTAGVSSDDSHIVSGAVLAKNPQSVTVSKTSMTADGSDSVVFGSITNPSSCVIEVPVDAVGIAPFTITDGTLTFKTFVPGVYTITIDYFPYLPFVQTITAS